jgi:nickel transport protein
MSRFCRPLFAAALGLSLTPALSPAPAGAHAIQSSLDSLHVHSHPAGGLQASAAPTPGQLRLSSSFSTGQPVVAAAVRLAAPDGRAVIELGRTDAQGSLTFNLPQQVRPDWELQVDGGPGHRDYLELPGVTAQALPTGASGEFAQSARHLGLLALVGSLGLGSLAFGRRRS